MSSSEIRSMSQCVCSAIFRLFIYHRIVKLTSPNLNHIIILGSVLLYICVFFYTFRSTDETTETVFCNVRYNYQIKFVNIIIFIGTCVAIFLGILSLLWCYIIKNMEGLPHL